MAPEKDHPLNKFRSWEDYLYPPDYNVLINILNERNFDKLQLIESESTAVKEAQIIANLYPINRTYDFLHLASIHRHLFSEIYEWAGYPRRVNMGKGTSTFADVTTNEIPRQINDITHGIKSTKWDTISPNDFAMSNAFIYAKYNFAHPFREGNGRTGKLFLTHVAEQSPFSLDFTVISRTNAARDRWNELSARSMPSPLESYPNPRYLYDVFRIMTIDRNTGKPVEGNIQDLSNDLHIFNCFSQPRSKQTRNPNRQVPPNIQQDPSRYHGR